ncbi:MAG TPA: amidohydrolase family protein, partial [Spirochaetia bacterium]|nr:amidohydrolase family protein [Spirochaetia bacterium]
MIWKNADEARGAIMIIDCHVHMLSDKGYDEKLIKEVRRLGIDRICLLAMHPEVPGWGSFMASNEIVIRTYEKYPEIVIPFGFFDLGLDPPGLVDELHTAGFKGIKFTRARLNYDDKSLYPVYERMERCGMAALFHTGTVLRTPIDKKQDVNSNRLRPIYLDPIARAFPKLNIIGAHLGNPWYDEAAMTIFWNPNVHFDLSGTILKRKKADWFKETLWWFPEVMEKLAPDKETTIYRSAGSAPHPFDRIVFGTDVPIPEMEQAKHEYERIL